MAILLYVPYSKVYPMRPDKTRLRTCLKASSFSHHHHHNIPSPCPTLKMTAVSATPQTPPPFPPLLSTPKHSTNVLHLLPLSPRSSALTKAQHRQGNRILFRRPQQQVRRSLHRGGILCNRGSRQQDFHVPDARST